MQWDAYITDVQVPLHNNVKPSVQYPWQNKTYLFLLHWFKNLNDTFLIVSAVNTLKHLTIFSSPHLPHNLIIILVPVKRTPLSKEGKNISFIQTQNFFLEMKFMTHPTLGNLRRVKEIKGDTFA